MRLVFFSFIVAFLCQTSAAQNYSHNYERFFGTDDRIGLYSELAEQRFSAKVLKTIRRNTLLMDCGTSGKPSTAFVAKAKNSTHIISAAHNLTMAQTKGQDCKIGLTILPNGQTSKAFKDSGTKDDVANDVAIWENTTQQTGFKICQDIDTSADYILIQSLDGTGRLGVSPWCKIKSVDGNLITSTCRGHYKASGSPLLAVSENDVCAVGVFNAHSGKLFGYESYAANLTEKLIIH